jgi:hypothetical protein
MPCLMMICEGDHMIEDHMNQRRKGFTRVACHILRACLVATARPSDEGAGRVLRATIAPGEAGGKNRGRVVDLPFAPPDLFSQLFDLTPFLFSALWAVAIGAKLITFNRWNLT